MNYGEALQKGFILEGPPPTPEEQAKIEESLKAKPFDLYGLRFPERDAKTDADYMRLSFQEEDEEWRKEQAKLTLTDSEQKRLPREVLTDNWEEDMSLYEHKKK